MASRACIRLGAIREFLLTTIVVLFLGTFLLMTLTDRVGRENRLSIAICLVAVTAVVLFIFFITNKKHAKRWEQMNRFRSSLYSFFLAFNNIFEKPGIKSSTSQDELRGLVSEEIIEGAQKILEAELLGQPTECLREHFKKMSSSANDFGLGSNWELYFSEARRRLNPYKSFAWEI